MPPAKKKPQYKVLKGINYPPDRRAEIGDLVDDIPPADITPFLNDGAIEVGEK